MGRCILPFDRAKSFDTDDTKVNFYPITRIGDFHATSDTANYLGGMNTNSGVYGHHGMDPYINTALRLKDYVICYDTNVPYVNDASNVAKNRIFCFDKEGKRTEVSSKHFSGIAYKPYRQPPIVFGAFDITTYENHPAYSNYWYAMQAGTNFIEVFNGPVSIGELPMESFGWKTDFPNKDEYSCLSTVPMKGKCAILVHRNFARAAYIIYINNDGESDVIRVPLTFLNATTGTNDDIYLMTNRVYSTYLGWIGLNQLNAKKNIFWSISDNGVGSAVTLSNVHASNTYDGTKGGIVEKNSNTVTIAINTYYGTESFYTSNFIRVINGDISNIEIIHLSYRWAHTSYLYQPISYEAFFDTNNYIYFIPSNGYAMYYSSTTGISHATTCLYTLPISISSNPAAAQVVNTYCRIKKSDNSVEFFTYPWAQTAAAAQTIKWLRTKDDYVWVMPPRQLKTGKFLCISPNDEIKEIDTGDTTYSWMGAAPACAWSGDSRYPSGYFAARSAVNEDGIGCIIDTTGTAIMLFWGDGNYYLKVFLAPGEQGFGVGKRLFFVTGLIARDVCLSANDYNLGTAIIPIGKSFLMANGHGDYFIPTIIKPEIDKEDKISVENLPAYYPGVSAYRLIYAPDCWDYNRISWDYTDAKKVNNKVLPISFNQGSRWGYLVERNVSKDKDVERYRTY